MQNFFLAVILAAAFVACSSDDDPVDCEKSGPVIILSQATNATSCSTSDGSILVAVSGGKEPYSFFLNDQLIESTGQFDNLKAGIYFVVVQDENKCTATLDNVAIGAQDFSFQADVQPNTSCLSDNGSVTIEVASDNPPYTYKLGNGDFTSNNSFSALASGNHIIAVRDNNNCVVTLSITVPQGSTGTSWVNDIKPIMDKSCAISGCHNGVSRSNDFRLYTSAKSFASTIKSKTQNRSMPFDGSIPQNQIDLIACWVDDGALNN